MPINAQTIQPQEIASNYAQVRGWDVYSITNPSGAFLGCRALKYEEGEPLILGREPAGWNIVVRTTQSGRFGGAILGIDKFDFDAQFGFDKGYATKALSRAEFRKIKQGNALSVEIIGERPHYWSLSGSTAAILKVKECSKRRGNQPRAQIPLPVAPVVPARPAPKPKPKKPNGVLATCETPTNGRYLCNVIKLPPEPGYIEVYRIEDPSFQVPTYFFRLKANQDSDAWISYNGGRWRDIGVWVGSGSSCSVPSNMQTNAAQRNLGQDAWKLCVYP